MNNGQTDLSESVGQDIDSIRFVLRHGGVMHLLHRKSLLNVLSHKRGSQSLLELFDVLDRVNEFVVRGHELCMSSRDGIQRLGSSKWSQTFGQSFMIDKGKGTLSFAWMALLLGHRVVAYSTCIILFHDPFSATFVFWNSREK